MSVTRTIRIGTRGSALAVAQSRWVADRLEALGLSASLEIIVTTGDRMPDIPLPDIDAKGIFVSEIEQALLESRIDMAVHSMKDLPPNIPDGIISPVVPVREDPRDVLVGRTAPTLLSLPDGAVVGTSSPRRKAQLLAARPDLHVVNLRGNVDTRVRKLDEGQYDAICIAAAGLHRLGLKDRITEYLDTDVLVPAAGQGALSLQIRAEDHELLSVLQALHDDSSARAVRAERAVLNTLGWGCSVPLGVLAVNDGKQIHLNAALCSLDGKAVVRERLSGADPEDLGCRMAERLRISGKHLLEDDNCPAT
ncbi:MAG: hydroxymethylbilane synthase [Armatimonadota bacterium]